ncbi:Far1-related sequence like, partial [Thalictrum thalictroides]
ETVEEFECNWGTMLAKYGLGSNQWLMNLYEKREKWASVYSRDICSACMYTSHPCENAYFDGYLRRDMPLCEFLKQLERAITDKRATENDADFESNEMPVLKLTVDIEKEAAAIYTKEILQKFQDQLLESLSYRHKRVAETGTKSMYNVWKNGQTICSVAFDNCDASTKCSCQLFEFSGYLCRHILKVFLVEDVQNLPPHYILKRWTKDVKCGPVVDVQDVCLQIEYHEAPMVQYQKLCQEAINLAIKGSSSIEVYKVALRCLRNTLKEVETSLRNV